MSGYIALIVGIVHFNTCRSLEPDGEYGNAGNRVNVWMIFFGAGLGLLGSIRVYYAFIQEPEPEPEEQEVTESIPRKLFNLFIGEPFDSTAPMVSRGISNLLLALFAVVLIWGAIVVHGGPGQQCRRSSFPSAHTVYRMGVALWSIITIIFGVMFVLVIGQAAWTWLMQCRESTKSEEEKEEQRITLLTQGF